MHSDADMSKKSVRPQINFQAGSRLEQEGRKFTAPLPGFTEVLGYLPHLPSGAQGMVYLLYAVLYTASCLTCLINVLTLYPEVCMLASWAIVGLLYLLLESLWARDNDLRQLKLASAKGAITAILFAKLIVHSCLYRVMYKTYRPHLWPILLLQNYGVKEFNKICSHSRRVLLHIQVNKKQYTERPRKLQAHRPWWVPPCLLTRMIDSLFT